MIPRLDYTFNFSDFRNSLKGISQAITSDFLSTVFPNKKILFSNHARTSLRIALSALELPKGSYIGVQAFNCITVFDAIRNAGHIPLFIDINENFMLDISDLSNKQANIKALIITHIFGLSQPILEIKKTVNQIPIIEDCAHSFLSEYEGKKTGLLSDISIFSFGMGKFPSIGDGGFMVVNNEKYFTKVDKLHSNLSTVSTSSELKSIIGKLIISTLANPIIYSIFTFPFLKKADKKSDFRKQHKHIESSPLKNNVHQFRCKIGLIEKLLQLQQKNAKEIVDILKIKAIHCPTITDNWNGFMLPLIVSDRDTILKNYIKFGVEVGKHFSSSIDWAKQYGYIENSCPHVEYIVKNIITIPTYSTLTANQIKKIKAVTQKIL